MKYISLFSGIETASVAWEPLGWTPAAFAEIDPFASAVLAHHWPDVPNHGDVTAFDWTKYRGQCDMVIGGAPCTSYSVAGLRKSLDDPRGRLTLAFVKACNDIDPPFVLFENVPAIGNTKDNAYGHFLAGLVGESEPLRSGHKRGKWPDAGMVIGPKRAACWTIMDACRRGVPQRRRRLFCLAVKISHPAFPLGKTPNPAAVLLEPQGGTRRPPAGGTSRKETRRAARSRPPRGGGLFPEMRLEAWDPGPDVSPTVVGGPPFSRTGNGRVECSAIIPDNAPTVTAKWGKGVGGPAGDECRHLVPTEPYVIRLAQTSSKGLGIEQGVTHTLDASGPEAVAYPLLEVGKRIGPSNDKAHSGAGIGEDGDPMFTLQAGAKHGVVRAMAFSVKDSGADAGEIAPTLRAMGHAASHPNGGGQVAVATVSDDVAHTLRGEGFDASEDGTGRGTPLVAIGGDDAPECSSLAIRGREGGLSAETLPGDAAHALRAAQGTLDKPHVLLPNVVRRLTALECERLQGFSDNHTLIPYGRNRRVKDLAEMAAYWGVSEETAKTLAADSLRYKAIGNSMAVPVIWWIGLRIDWVLERLAAETPT